MLKRRRELNPNVLAGAGPSATSAAHSRRSRRTDVRGLAMKPRGRGGPERPPGSPEARRLWRGHKEGGRRGGTGSLRRGPGEEAACHLLALLAAPIAIIPWPGDGLCLDTPAALPPPRNGSAMDTDPVTEDSAQPPSSEAWELGMQRGQAWVLHRTVVPWPASSGGRVTREKLLMCSSRKLAVSLGNKTKALGSLQRHLSDPRMKCTHSAFPTLQPAQLTLNNEPAESGRSSQRGGETGFLMRLERSSGARQVSPGGRKLRK